MPSSTHLALLPLCALLGAGCWRENPAFAEGASFDTGDTTNATSSSGGGVPGTDATGTGTGGATGGATTGGDATTQPVSGSDAATGDAGTTAAPGSTGTTDGTTGEPPMCAYDVIVPPPRLKVLKDGAEILACGGVVKTLDNARVEFVGGGLRIHDSGDCAPGGPLYELIPVGFTISPVNLSDNCSTARLEWAAESPCDLGGFALDNADAPVFVGGFGRLDPPEGHDNFAPEPHFDCGCAVDGATCCAHATNGTDYQPGLYALAFPGVGDPVAAQQQAQGAVDGTAYLFSNLSSNVHTSCEPTPPHVWLDMRWWAARSD